MMSVTNPGSADGFSLSPVSAYADPLDSMDISRLPLEIGAYPLTANEHVESLQMKGPRYNYPNPFNRVTEILLPPEYDGASEVVLSLYNQAGCLVLESAHPVHGTYIEFDRGIIPAGIYHYRIASDNGQEIGIGSMVICP
jgi:hypothetical protein